MDSSHRRRGSGFHCLSVDNQLKVFSFLDPLSLARSCMVCKSWNMIIMRSSLWKGIYRKSKKAEPTCEPDDFVKLTFLESEIEAIADWKAQFVKEHHNSLIVFGSVHARDQKGHSARIECCRFKMDIIMTGSSDGIVHVWSSKDLRCLHKYLISKKQKIVDLEFDENKVLVVSSTDIYIWNRKKGELLRHVTAHMQPIYSMCYADPEVFLGCADGAIRVFDIYSGRCVRIFRQHSDRVTCIAAHTSFSLLATGSYDGTVQLCDLTTGEKMGCLLPSLPPRGVLCLHVCYEENKLFAGTTAGDVHAWSLRTKGLIWSVRIAANAITSLHMQFYDPTTLFVGSIDGVLTIVHSETGSMLKQYIVREERKQNGAGYRSVLALEKPTIGSLSYLRKQCLPILSLRSGMTKLVTTHPDGSIRLWHFRDSA